MKATIFSILLVVSALLLIGFTSNAQIKPSDRDWIDSLAVTYRGKFLESLIIDEQAVIDSLGDQLDQLLVAQQASGCAFSRGKIVSAVRHFVVEQEAQQFRKRAYDTELRLARRDFDKTE